MLPRCVATSFHVGQKHQNAILLPGGSNIVTGRTLPKTTKIGRAPKGNDRIPTIHFQVLYEFQGGYLLDVTNNDVRRDLPVL